MNKSNYNFDKIYAEYKPQIFRYLARMIGREEAEDLTQDVFMKVNRNLDKFNEDSSLSTWIYRIATNTAIDRIRTLSRKSAHSLIGEDELLREDQSAWSEKVLSIDQKLIEKEMNECVRNYINTLPENYRTVLVLSELEVMKNQEIADILGVTLDTVKIRLHRARARLKKVLQGNCNFYYNYENKLA